MGAEHETVVPALNQGGGILSARAIAWLSQRRGREGSGSKNIGGWSALAIGVALLVSVPIVAPALIIVAAGLIPVALLSLAISRARPGRAQVAVRP